MHSSLQRIRQFLVALCAVIVRNWRPFLEFMASVISPLALVGATLAIFYVSHGQWQAFTQQLEEMKKTNKQTDALIEIARQHADAAIAASRLAADNQRPILSLDEAEAVAPLVFGSGARTTIRFVFSNKGRTTVEDAHLSVTFFPQGEGRNRRVAGPEQRYVCKEVSGIAEKSKGRGFRIGSNGKEPRDLPVTIRYPDLQKGLIKSTERTPGLFATEVIKTYVNLFIVGCVDYKFGQSVDRHQMQFVGNLVRIDDSDSRISISPDDAVIRAEELKLLVSSNPLD